MIRKNVFFHEDDVAYLETVDSISFSEHVRIAIKSHIAEIKAQELNVASSPSGKHAQEERGE